MLLMVRKESDTEEKHLFILFIMNVSLIHFLTIFFSLCCACG